MKKLNYVALMAVLMAIHENGVYAEDLTEDGFRDFSAAALVEPTSLSDDDLAGFIDEFTRKSKGGKK